MTIKGIISRKRDGGSMSNDEIDFFISQLTNGKIPEYQTAALLMAIYQHGMQTEELSHFTLAMTSSGSILKLDHIDGTKVDKHSTGGVGDKTTLVVGPMVAAAGVIVTKLSGKGLAHTGGTLDKLSVFPGLRFDLSLDEFSSVVEKVGLAISGQTEELVPADKMLYALRDATATVASLPLIASSIMSKKIAGGADAIILDVKVGSGSSCQTRQEAQDLAETMVHIGNSLGRRTQAILSSMYQPLGNTVGNALEVKEAIETLQGSGPRDLLSLSLQIGTIMLEMAGITIDRQEAIALLDHQIKSGAALKKWGEMIEAQGGDSALLSQPEKLSIARFQVDWKATASGFISRLDAHTIGEAAMMAGAGRLTKDGPIDLSAGVILHKKLGDEVSHADPILSILGSDIRKLEEALKLIPCAIEIGINLPSVDPIVIKEL
ncbi:MAG: thymidine phosphorylase [Saprospiraceae bacterium]|nr:thymidine phosphorylase [Saprospiraceae bacterium]